jgi:hypothetical protein
LAKRSKKAPITRLIARIIMLAIGYQIAAIRAIIKMKMPANQPINSLEKNFPVIGVGDENGTL